MEDREQILRLLSRIDAGQRSNFVKMNELFAEIRSVGEVAHNPQMVCPAYKEAKQTRGLKSWLVAGLIVICLAGCAIGVTGSCQPPIFEDSATLVE